MLSFLCAIEGVWFYRMGSMYDATCYRYSFVTRVKIRLLLVFLSHYDLGLETECKVTMLE